MASFPDSSSGSPPTDDNFQRINNGGEEQSEDGGSNDCVGAEMSEEQDCGEDSSDEETNAEDETVGAEVLSEMSSEDEFEAVEPDIPFVELRIKYEQLRVEHQNQRNRFQRRIERFKEKIDEKNETIAALRREIAELKKRNSGQGPPTPWGRLYDEYIAGPGDWEDVYKASCRQGNMSRKPDVHHPDITFTHGPQLEAYEDVKEESSENVSKARRKADNTAILSQTFKFESLPINIQSRIFRLLLVKGNPIHALSRLDFNNPNSVVVIEQRKRFPHKFWWKTSPCCISTAEDPNDILRMLRVCKRWLYVGVAAFYGLNTFAFSSFGEMGRFFKGIGRARCERVTSIELLWQGALLPTHVTHVNQRTKPLLYLTRLKNLQTMLIFIEESPQKRMRRKYEMQEKSHYDEDYSNSDIWDLDTFQSMTKQTSTHPNFRGYRSMRTTHGMDYIYQLRGMSWVRFREVSSDRNAIRDWSFATDISSVATMPKSPKAKREAEIENLEDLCGEWDPSALTVELVKSFYQPSNLDFVVGGSETSNSDDNSISIGTNSDNSSASSLDPSEVSISDFERSNGGHARTMFPDEMDESRSNSRQPTPWGQFPDEMDNDSGIEDMGTDCGSETEEVDMESHVLEETENSNPDISEPSRYDTDVFEGDNNPFYNQDPTTPSNRPGVNNDARSVDTSSGLFVRSDRDDLDSVNQSAMQSRRSDMSGPVGSINRMPPFWEIVDLTAGEDNELSSVHFESGCSNDISTARHVIDLTGIDGDERNNREEERTDTVEEQLQVEAELDNTPVPSSSSAHPKRLRDDDHDDTVSEPPQKRPYNETFSRAASL